VAICSLVSPYREARAQVRKLIGQNFVEVYVDASLSTCILRDVKNMYAEALRGARKKFTGIDDDFEPPLQPELKIHTDGVETPDESVARIVRYLETKGFLNPEEKNYDGGGEKKIAPAATDPDDSAAALRQSFP
jgi:adenylylsulfate kinase-like enzyme